MIISKAMSHVNQDRQAARSRQNAEPDLGLSKEESNSGSPPRLTGDPSTDAALWRLSLTLREIAQTKGEEKTESSPTLETREEKADIEEDLGHET